MTGRGKRALVMAVAIALASTGVASAAEDTARGEFTNLPLPRFVSLKASEGNLRRGPGLGHRIDWVLKRRGMPLVVTAEFGHWRRVQDQDGAGGWIHYALLSGERTVLVEEDMVALRSKPEADASIRARAELGVIGRLGKCTSDWCEISSEGQRGWVTKAALWGVDEDEIRE